MPGPVKPVVLTILDGWGIAPPGQGNAVSLSNTPNISSLSSAYVHTQLIAHGESVGLPKREPGNTETGHLNLGAGRIVYQDLPRINMSVADGSFFQNPALLAAANHVKKKSSRLHLLGLIGGGGVHSDLSHFFALLRFCHEQQIPQVFLHLFTDGRDSPPSAAMTYVKQLQTVMTREGVGKIASVMGRYYAMDRDFRWDRTAKAYSLLTAGIGNKVTSIESAISASYVSNLTDEFIEPTVIVNPDSTPVALVANSDAVIFVNFRIDRPRQLTKAFVLPDFEKTANTTGFDPYAIKYLKKHEIDAAQFSKQAPFTRNVRLKDLLFVTMTEYESNLQVLDAFPPQVVENPLGRVVSDHNLRQLRVSESEKERFVTYYFNGLREDRFSGEDHIIIPSPKVSTYDKQPEMSARILTDRVLTEIRNPRYDLIVINYANPDMIGHTGNINAAVKACEAVDSCLGDLASTVIGADGILIITSDHGNAEEMINMATGGIDTEHNSNPVPFIVAANSYRFSAQIPQGILADVAPTVLSLMHIPIPINMTGRNLLSSLPSS
ncbi:phosphoglycerate mutase (2,3-diphosphoglycerate-independent) [Candidatus Amesbacteria bacterium RIFCSPHIGHO2_02_FULL_48_21]|uniref:2,3-bisphosphoglycerate-independent phosphoglycerate mutase n=4 Tax=Candidatus Amesiibacteriota TaxID=1752730 RepID=A0A1F4Z8J6_9BACT|nr:MAG: 2,3-bisphosphoglycerate-independent phosphoglycerate mutase [Candidatus Amesbacteria bacterium GW2011_GWA2_47_11]KKU99875.1 MAG: 2,3-bisphosphoglycerate-independent phosphoglycerate mutase [Candidatus Amesbacteria bacterium GW2011_GWA1_48_9]OGC97196.1 MAG: phosphoglycerate mutase (2,3-diphosphoglycerate-independent) [Candidatus Amesbacteria bacterium RIFCSPHIGHO2_02_FULL_48_21]OGC98710.1 MAG: phosphoglycerate mutase (2,3-diphosphoglycerate-independent) [Candidatus Amesbacteria bacterium 